MGTVLDLAGKLYFAQVDISDKLLAEDKNMTVNRSLSVGMTGYAVVPNILFGNIVGINEGSLFIDIDRDVHGVVSNVGDKEQVKEYMLTAGMMSSNYESVIWEEFTGMESVSTISVLKAACDSDIEVVMLSSGNFDKYRDKLKLSDNVFSEVENAVNEEI